MRVFDIVIAGSGIGGICAALAAARENCCWSRRNRKSAVLVFIRLSG